MWPVSRYQKGRHEKFSSFYIPARTLIHPFLQTALTTGSGAYYEVSTLSGVLAAMLFDATRLSLPPENNLVPSKRAAIEKLVSPTASVPCTAVVASVAMWATVIVLALLATADPVRIGVSVVLSSRPHAVGQLAAFWLGGIAMCVAIAAGVLYGMRDAALSVMRWGAVATASSTGGRIQIAMGVLALLVAGLAVGLSPRQRERLGLPGPSAPAGQTLTSNTAASVSARAQSALHSKPIPVAFILGFAMLADFRLLAALAAMLASGATAGAQIAATGLYTLIALTFIELPLASRLAAPTWTAQMMETVNGWMKARRQHVFALVVALLGAFLMTRGISHA